MRLASVAATWVLVTTFPQGSLYRMDQEGTDVVALRAEGTLRAPAWAVREVLLRGWKYGGISPYLAERRLLHADRCEAGATELPGCRTIWAYERYEPPFVGARDYAFRMEIGADDLDRGGDFELAWDIDESHGKPPEGSSHMRMNRGAWEISPAGRNTRFRYRLSADPGGSLPGWIVNVANRSQIPSVISAVEGEAQKLAEARKASTARP